MVPAPMPPRGAPWYGPSSTMGYLVLGLGTVSTGWPMGRVHAASGTSNRGVRFVGVVFIAFSLLWGVMRNNMAAKGGTVKRVMCCLVREA